MFSSMTDLESLDLSHSGLSWSGSSKHNVTLPPLWQLSLAFCHVKVFPDFLLNAKELGSLDMSGNEIQGQLPKWVDQESGIFAQITPSCNGHWSSIISSLLLQEVICRFNVKRVAASCVWLASKLEESPEKSKAGICKFISNYLATLETPAELRQEAWNLANDSLRTTLCVRFKSEVVACGVVYAAAVDFKYLSQNPPWWKAFDADKGLEGGSFATSNRSRDSPSLPVSKEGLLDVPPVNENTEEVAKDATKLPLIS
ncbi:hypothetical protein HAX54_022598 [Datura stramonium]|uniref:Uncharacterized protein n=1 Tax=Datura stramonium TaxID=4076 RepID=A0ABS8S583_DATST|nr:hypothetical protein [Datura stramonium]